MVGRRVESIITEQGFTFWQPKPGPKEQPRYAFYGASKNCGGSPEVWNDERFSFRADATFLKALTSPGP